jgi:hypothetical protein
MILFFLEKDEGQALKFSLIEHQWCWVTKSKKGKKRKKKEEEGKREKRKRKHRTMANIAKTIQVFSHLYQY